jgi:hypothetical protein
MRNSLKKLTLSLTLLLTLVAACSPSETLPREDRLATIVAKTLTAQPTDHSPTPIPTLTTETPVSTATILSTSTDASPADATANEPVFVRTIVQNVNLRTNPGTLFQVSRVMPEGTRLQVLGLSPGGEWVYVLNDEDINGWVGIQIVEDFSTEQFPTVEPEEVQRITGRVLDEDSQPVSGIGYAIEQQNASNTLRTDAVTDATGMFYVYLPQSYSGVWTVSHVSVSCTSNTMDADCNCLNGICGTSYPLSASVNLPVSEPLAFVWK